jgi:hypothetical protein
VAIIMTSRTKSLDGLLEGELRLDRLLGRRVRARNNRSVGRLEEVRAEQGAAGWVITAYVIGAAGLLERLGVGVKLLFGRRSGGHIAAWDQLDISDPDHPRLTCRVEELEPLTP